MKKKKKNNEICIKFVFCSWLARFFVIFPPLFLGLNLDFCASNTVDHFYCDTTPLLQICSDTEIFETMGYISALVTLVVTLIISYTFITKTILKIPPSNQRKKAFSTCSSHMVVITLYYGSCIFIYAKPSVKQWVSFSKGIAVLQYLCCTTFEPFYLLFTELTSEKRLCEYDTQDSFFLKEVNRLLHYT